MAPDSSVPGSNEPKQWLRLAIQQSGLTGLCNHLITRHIRRAAGQFHPVLGNEGLAAAKYLEEKFADKIQPTFVESVAEGADAERVITQLAKSGNDLIFTTSFVSQSLARVLIFTTLVAPIYKK